MGRFQTQELPILRGINEDENPHSLAPEELVRFLINEIELIPSPTQLKLAIWAGLLG